jgi:hypothetical protein
MVAMVAHTRLAKGMTSTSLDEEIAPNWSLAGVT